MARPGRIPVRVVVSISSLCHQQDYVDRVENPVMNSEREFGVCHEAAMTWESF
jgi:hypothetical protein